MRINPALNLATFWWRPSILVGNMEH